MVRWVTVDSERVELLDATCGWREDKYGLIHKECCATVKDRSGNIKSFCCSEIEMDEILKTERYD